MKIYTKTGDDGTTGLFGGQRVPKDDPRIEAYGNVDELNATLGIARAAGLPADLDAQLGWIQEDLFAIGADLADPRPSKDHRVRVPEERIAAIEHWIDAMEEKLPALRSFILPGGSAGGAALHLARTVCRRTERGVVALSHKIPDANAAVKYLNRLADALFVAARFANKAANAPETEWHPR